MDIRDNSAGAAQHETNVDLAGLMAVLSQHMYSTPEVAIREIVQNSHDSIMRRQHLALDGRAELSTDAPEIIVSSDEDRSIVTISDTGSGLTESEIRLLLATVGVGATRHLREESDDPDLIGMFGLGFLSSFVVADDVRLRTTSAMTPDETYEYRSGDGLTFTLDRGDKRPVGTTVDLHLKNGFSDLADPQQLRALLDRYCRLLSVPITLAGESTPINLTPPWRTGSSSREEQLEFAAAYDGRFEPLAAIPVGSMGEDFVGQLWLHGGSTYGNADNRHMSVFVRGMLLTENDQDLLPRWAGFVSGVVESHHLTPTASRESLQKDEAYEAAQEAIREALINGISDLAKHDLHAWRRVLARHSDALLGAAVADERVFEVAAEDLTVPTTQGPKTVATIADDRRVHISLESDSGFEELLFAAQGIPVARGDLYGVRPFVQAYAEANGLDVVELGTNEGNAKLFQPVSLELDDLAWIERELANDDEAVTPVRFDPPSVPLVVVPDREAALKKRVERDEFDARAGSGPASLARLHTANITSRADNQLFINMSCPTVQRLLENRETNAVGAQRAVTLLRTLKTMMSSMDARREARTDLATALEDAMSVLDGLMLGPTTAHDSGEGET